SDTKVNWWADCCESDQSSEFSDDDTYDDLPDLITRNDDSDDDDEDDDEDDLPDLISRNDDDDDEDDLTVLTNDEVYDDDDLVLIIPNDDDSTGEPIVIGLETTYTDEEMNEWCTVHEIEEQEVDEVCLTTGLKKRIDDNLMIGDSGATVHMRRDTSGMYDLREEKCIIKYGNGAQSTSTVVGKWAGMIKDNGVLKKVILDGVTVVPGSAYNLFSLTRALNKGIVKSNGETMILECNGTTIRFDHRIETANGFLLAARFEPMELQDESAHVSLKEGTNVQISKFHTIMGHANEDSIRLTAKHMGVILTGKMMKCEPCAIGKLKQTSVPKVASREVTKPGEVMYMDTASIDKPSMGSKKFWFLFVDGFSDHTISCFGKHKSDLMRVGIDMLLDLKTKDIVVKTIRCDNAGENKMLEQACRKQGLQIIFEYTAPGTPQQNGVVERKFATLFGKIREDAQDDDQDSQLGIGEDDHNVPDNSEVENQEEENTQDEEWQEVRAGRERLIYQPKPTGQTRSGSTYKAAAMIAKGISTANSFQALDDTVVEDISKEEEFADIQEYVLYAEGKFEEPKTFQEAWNHPDPEERKKWREAIRKEFHDMIVRKVWRKTNKSSIPSHRRLIGCKWIFKKKKDGRYRARLCALGYSQIPGEDFMDTSSPVVDDVTVRIVIACMMINGWENEVVDITTAFLHGDMEEEVYMKCPDGIDLIEEGWNLDNDCVELLQTIYGTKQAARQYWKKFMYFMKEKGFERTHAEPCLLKRIDSNGTVVICVYVDDCLLTGDRKAINAAMVDIESAFETRRLGPLEEYIGCSVIEQHDGSKKLIQPDMIKKIEKEFGDAVSYLKNMKVPMASGINVIRPTEDDPLLSPEDQKDYRSAVGMLLYLVKHSRPDLSNSVRELSKVMDGATDEHVTILHRVIKFVIDTKNRGVLIKPDKNRGVIAYCDSDFAGDMGNRRSITGFLIYLFGVPISWKSKQQGGVTLSSSEAEYYAISEVSMELKFIKMVMDFLDIDPGIPMKVYVDNIGAIHLANNASSGSRTKHIDTRLHFVRELTQGDDKIIDIEFVRSEENQSDTFTKNTSNDTFWRLTSKYMVGD
ncbi:reverse transcriptase RNA-dependent DNA polymerase, partial [Nitzschia inconspicua]